jgi:hypothetical protein
MPFVRRNGPGSSPNGLPLEIVRIYADFTVSPNHCGAVLKVTSGSTVTISLPGDLPVGFTCLVQQAGAGVVVLDPVGLATMVNRQDFDRTAGQHAVCTLYVDENAIGTNAEWLLGGDGAVAE